MEGEWGTGHPDLRVLPVIPTSHTKDQVRASKAAADPSKHGELPPLPEPHSPHTVHVGQLRPKDRTEQSPGHQVRARPPRSMLPTQPPPAALWGGGGG